MAINVTGEIIIPASDSGMYAGVYEQYASANGTRRVRHTQHVGESDFYNRHTVCYSDDNGRTWGPETDVYDKDFTEARDSSWEILIHDLYTEVYNPAHKHFTGAKIERIFRGGRKAAYKAYWSEGQFSWTDHIYITVRGENDTETARHLIKYEPGPDFDPENPLNDDYFNKNFAVCINPYITDNGDILIALNAPVKKCCDIMGMDANGVFPSNPRVHYGVIVCRGVWDGHKYNLSFSRPVVISDLLSSRGLDEPAIAVLKNGRILVVCRGANVISKQWNTRIEPGAPGLKWYFYSDDGGRTFTEPMPWRFDDGEVIYSSATISGFIRPKKNGKLYWTGNVTGHRVEGNYPRWPLNIVEVDETYGTAKKDTLTVIDTKRGWESELVQLSNYSMLEDRETGDIELWLSKIGQYGNNWQKAETWKYRINLGG